MSEEDNRFKALIQPIKDIASNWDIDIADSLTEYLEELESLRISIDGGKSNLNFAEAALLIQGSTAVYSKKVEYLHQLVLQSLEYITNRKGTNNTSSSNPTKVSKSIDDDDILLFDKDASFLLLDHIVEEGHNINLKAPVHVSKSDRNSRNSYSSGGGDNNTSRVSMSLMQSILSDDQGTASLKLSTSLVDSSGALLVCGALPGTSSCARINVSSRSSLMNSFNEPSHIQNPSSFHADGTDMMQNDDEGADYYDAGDDGGDWGGAMEEEVIGAQQSVPGVDTVHPFTVPSRAATPMKSGSASANAAQPKPARASTAPAKDMFAQLDPHVATSGSREARRGKTYKIPPALLNPPAISTDFMETFKHVFDDYKMSSAQLMIDTGKVPITGLFDTSFLPILQRKRKKLRKERLAAVRMQRQAAIATAGSDDEAIQYQNLNLSATGAANTSRVEELWSQDYADYGSDGGGDFGDAGGDDFEDQQAQPSNEGLSNALESSGHFGDDGITGGSGEEHFMEESEEEILARRVASVLNDELHQSTHTSYESICQKFIDNFNQGAHLFAKETQLSKRVAEWTQRLEPILQQQEEAPQFDIHDYCATFLEDVCDAEEEQQQLQEQEDYDGEDIQDGVSFGEVVSGKSSGEVCRIFLACLQLINQGNVVITPAQGVDQWTFAATTASRLSSDAVHQDESDKHNSSKYRSIAVHPFKVRRNRAQKGRSLHDASAIENFRAPSINQNRGPSKSALKSATKEKSAKGTKRVHVDIPSNVFFNI